MKLISETFLPFSYENLPLFLKKQINSFILSELKSHDIFVVYNFFFYRSFNFISIIIDFNKVS